MAMLDIKRLVAAINSNPNCVVYPPEGIPSIQPNHSLPEDLREFYKLCGGANLFIDSAFPTLIVPPARFKQANITIFADMDLEQVSRTQDDMSWSWYLIGIGPNSQYITIDLSNNRLGNCYDSFWDRHPRDSYIVARTFTDLLKGLLSTQGEYYYWDNPDFIPIGSPYEN